MCYRRVYGHLYGRMVQQAGGGWGCCYQMSGLVWPDVWPLVWPDKDRTGPHKLYSLASLHNVSTSHSKPDTDSQVKQPAARYLELQYFFTVKLRRVLQNRVLFKFLVTV